MTEWSLGLLASYGVPLLALVSCLALPAATSFAMLAAGAFAASGDLPLASVTLVALVGAILGDQIGVLIRRRGQMSLDHLIRAYPRRAAILARASELLRQRGSAGVFLSRWLASPHGPYSTSPPVLRTSIGRGSAFGADLVKSSGFLSMSG